MRKRLDGGYGWAIVAANFIIAACVYGSSKTNGLMFVYFRDEYNASNSATAAISLTQRLSETSTALVFNLLAERYGSRPVMLVGGVFLVSGGIASAFAKNIFSMTLTYGVIMGLGCSMLIYPSLLMLSQYFDKRIALAAAISVTGNSFGPLIFPIIMKYSILQYGLSGSFFIMAAMHLHVFIGGMLMRRPPQSDQTESSIATKAIGNEGDLVLEEQEPNNAGNDSKSLKTTLGLYKKCLSNKLLMLYYFTYMITAGVAMSFLGYQQAFVYDRGITDPTLLAILTSAWSCSEIVSRISCGFLVQAKLFPPYRLHQLSAVLMAAVFFVYPQVHEYWALMLCNILIAFLWSAMIVSLIPSIHLLVGLELTSAGLSLVCLPVLLAYASAQIGSYVRDVVGSFVPVFYGCSIALLVAACSIELIAWYTKSSLFHKIAACCGRPSSDRSVPVKEDL